MSLQRRFSFLVVCILSFYGEIFGQKNTPIEAGISGLVSIPANPARFKPKFKPVDPKRADCFIAYGNPCIVEPRYRLLSIPATGCYVSSLGFICKKELQLDKITPIPFRFRLGSLEYVNWLEQKPNARRY